MRVHELAKELGVSSKILMDALAGMKIQVKSHSSSLNEGTVERVRRQIKSKTAPRSAPAPTPARIAKTPTGERILGMRKIVLPPPPPVETEAPAVEPAAAAPSAPPGSPVQAPPAPEATPAAEPPAAVKPRPPIVEGPKKVIVRPRVEPEAPLRPAAKPPGLTMPREGRPPVRPGAPLPGRPPVRPLPPRREAPPRAPVARPPVEAPPAAGVPAPTPAAPPQPREFPKKKERHLPPPPPPAPVAAPPVVPSEIEVSGPLTVGELAARLELPAGEVVKKLLEQGILAGINQQITAEAAVRATEAFGSSARKPAAAMEVPQRAAGRRLEVARDTDAQARAPVVTIMGHVDHGKTSLLDAIRKTDVASREFGGITQHIGASTVEADGRHIVFVDTPGHEAFTTLRARGAQVTDIAVLVVAADDGVMPQTVEAVNHARAANVPIIVAINKVDLPQANPDRVKQQLSDLGLVPEDWGGDTVTVRVSARAKQGLKELLEMILLVADLQELRANPARPARGTILEARLDKGRGPVATVLVQEGTLHSGDAIVTGEAYGRVRWMVSDRGERLAEAGPSTAVEVVGLDTVPAAGDLLEVVRDDKMATALAEERRERHRAAEMAAPRPGAGEDMAAQAEGPKELRLIIKADAHGSIEALSASLSRLATPEVGVSVLHAAVGNVTESDVMLAAASRAVIVGFNIRPEPPVRKLAEQEQIDILTYRVIYEAIDDIRDRLRGFLPPKKREVSLGQAEVRQTFTISKVGTVAGCYVAQGVITRSSSIRVIRDGVVMHEGKIASLRRFKEDAREVTEGFECGIALERYGDVKVGDLLEAFEVREEPA